MVKSGESGMRFGQAQKGQVDPALAFSAFMRDPAAGKVLTRTKDRPYNKINYSQWG